MTRLQALGILAVRRMTANWRLLASVALGTLVSSAILAATAVYSDAIRDLGLKHALQQAGDAADIVITRDSPTARGDAFTQSNTREDRVVYAAAGAAIHPAQRQGTSQTLYLTAPGDAVDETNNDRPRSQLRFRDDLARHVTVTAGSLAPGGTPAAGAPLPVVLGAEIATRNNVTVGARFDLHAWWDLNLPPLRVQVVGLVRPIDPQEAYWSGAPTAIDEPRQSWENFIFLLPSDAFFSALTASLPSASATYEDRYAVNADKLNARDAQQVATNVENLKSVLASSERQVDVATTLGQVLRSYAERLFFVRIPLFVLLLQIGGIVAYYLVMVSTMLVERQAPEMAVLRSRGASSWQLLMQFGIEGLILAAAAAAIGPLLAAGVISALGPTPPFRALSGGGPLSVHISVLAYAFAGAGALIALAAFMLPAWRATRTTVVQFRRASARPRPTPLLLRYYLDVALVLVVAILFWRLRQDEHLFTRTLFGDRSADPLLLSTPTVLMVTVGVVFLRLFPLLLRALAWAVGRIAGASALVVVRSLARDPTHYARLVLMLMLATGVGMFGATFSATLQRSYDDRARYAVGADVRAADPRTLFDQGDEAFQQAIAKVPAQGASAALRVEGSVLVTGKPSQAITVLGVDPKTFATVAYFRQDFAPEPLTQIVRTLDTNEPSQTALPLPVSSRQVGAWAKFPDIRGPITLLLSLRDANGKIAALTLGTIRPGDAATREWRFFATSLDGGLSVDGRAQPTLVPPLTFQALYVSTQSAIAAQRGVVLFGPLLTSASTSIPPPITTDGTPEPSAATFPDARSAYEFAGPEFQVIQGQRQSRTTDTVRPEGDAPPGAQGSARYEWADSRVTPRDRGLRPTSDGQPVGLYLALPVAEQAGLHTGDSFQVLLNGAYIDARLRGTFDFFPTYDPQATPSGFAVGDALRLISAVNASLPSRMLTLGEAWFASDNPAQTRQALEPLAPQTLLDTASERARAHEDPLIAAGWAGILGISFATVLMLSAIGFVLYSYITAQQRALEFAILRTLGFSRVQVFLVVACEYLVIVAAGMGLGTIVGLQVGRRMMDVLGVSEQGAAVVPPFALAVSWASVFVVWAVLGLAFAQAIAAVVLMYVRLAIHRALRVGEG